MQQIQVDDSNQNDLSFVERLAQNYKALEPTLKQIKQTKNTIILIGDSGAGKSTLANILNKMELVFEKHQFQYIPVVDKCQMQFKISTNCTKSETAIPQTEKISNDFQICDIPGLHDSKSGLNDILTCLNIQQIVNNSKAVQIIMLLQASSITSNKNTRFIETLNQFQENDFTFTLLLTFVKHNQKKQALCKQLEKLLDLQDTKLTEKAKKLLKRTLDRQEERVFVLSEPSKKEEENFLHFNKEEVYQIQLSMLRQELFEKLNLVFYFTDVNKQDIKTQQQKIETELNFIWNQLFEVSIKSSITRKSIQSYSYQQNLELLQIQEQDLKIKYLSKLSQMNYFRQLLREQNQLESLYENHYNELNNVLNFQNVDQSFRDIRIFCCYMSMSKLKEILKKYYQYDKVFIYTHVQFQVDESFIQQGLSLYIKTKEFIITSQNNVIISLKGNDGTPIHPTKAGQDQNNKKNGMNGINGNNGQNGGNLYVDSQLYHNMDLLDIDVSGGNGSDGQEGGDGSDGENGKDADPYRVDQKDQACRIKSQDFSKKEIENVQSQEEKKSQSNEEEQETMTLNRITIILLENQGAPGSEGGNAGVGGFGGFKGTAGFIDFQNYHAQKNKLINKDGLDGKQGKDGQRGKGGLDGKNYQRAYYDVDYLGKLKTNEVVGIIWGVIRLIFEILSGLTFFSMFQMLRQNDSWLTSGDFIKTNIRAQDGQLNNRNIDESVRDQNNHDLHVFQFRKFLEVELKKTQCELYYKMIN